MIRLVFVSSYILGTVLGVVYPIWAVVSHSSYYTDLGLATVMF